MTTLLECYLKAIRMYLPSGPQQADILNELAEHLQSKIEEREATLGRMLTEVEQVALLTEYGNPMIVADRYGATRHNVAFGRQWIGPELFPLYATILGLNWGVTLIALFVINPFLEKPVLTVGNVVFRLLAQFGLVTLIFACVDAFQRRSRRKTARFPEHAHWRFPPAYLQAVPRWQSMAGLACLGTVALWWAAIPHVPALILVRAADTLAFTPSWMTFYWPVLVVLLMGAAQRLATYLHPEWNWLQAITRLTTNGAALVLLYPFARAYPYVVVAAGSQAVPNAEQLARGVNNAFWWVTMAGFAVYWLITVGFHVWLCLQHLQYEIRRRREIAVAR